MYNWIIRVPGDSQIKFIKRFLKLPLTKQLPPFAQVFPPPIFFNLSLAIFTSGASGAASPILSISHTLSWPLPYPRPPRRLSPSAYAGCQVVRFQLNPLFQGAYCLLISLQSVVDLAERVVYSRVIRLLSRCIEQYRQCLPVISISDEAFPSSSLLAAWVGGTSSAEALFNERCERRKKSAKYIRYKSGQ